MSRMSNQWICAGCGREIEDVAASVNLTPDLLSLGSDMYFLDGPITVRDEAYDWCSVKCFARWVYREAMYASPRMEANHD